MYAIKHRLTKILMPTETYNCCVYILRLEREIYCFETKQQLYRMSRISKISFTVNRASTVLYIKENSWDLIHEKLHWYINSKCSIHIENFQLSTIDFMIFIKYQVRCVSEIFLIHAIESKYVVCSPSNYIRK